MTTTIVEYSFYFDCLEYADTGNSLQGVIEISLTPSGTWFNKLLSNEPVIPITVTPSSTFNPIQYLIPTNPIDITLTIRAEENFSFISTPDQHNWIWWSQIGHLDFSLDHTNEAGRAPMFFNGNVYNIMKLKNFAIVYGSEGIAKMFPSGVYWGHEPISNVGVKSRLASCGTEDVHWFIDTEGVLWEYSGQLKRLGYEEFLSNLNDISMNYYEHDNIIYICDGSTGYVYSIADDSLGKGPNNISGIINYANTQYVVSPGYVVIPTFELCTDIYDMGTRKAKTIFNLEIGVDADVKLQASIDFRVNHKDIFKSLPWFPVTHEGKAYINCYGIEFRFKLRALSYEEFDLDYFKVNGVIHGFSFLDTITMR